MSGVWEGLAQRLEGKLVVLEPLAPEHADGLRAGRGRSGDLAAHDRPRPARPSVFDDWFESTLANAQAGVEAPFAIVLRESGEPVGSSRYMTLRPEHRGLEIGWTWHRAARLGNGRERRGEAPPARATPSTSSAACASSSRPTRRTSARARRSRPLPARFEGSPEAHARPRRRAPRLGVLRDHGRRVARRAREPRARASASNTY